MFIFEYVVFALPEKCHGLLQIHCFGREEYPLVRNKGIFNVTLSMPSEEIKSRNHNQGLLRSYDSVDDEQVHKYVKEEF